MCRRRPTGFDTLGVVFPGREAFFDTLGLFFCRLIEIRGLEAARDQGNLNIRTIVTVTLSEFRNESADGARPGHQILQPILEQCDRVRQARKGRRPIQDVDPNTGEELAEEAAA